MKVISNDGEPLFERYHVLSAFGAHVHIHHYLRSDPDRGYHDHPWSWSVAWPIAGGYVESRVRPLWWNVTTQHSFEMIPRRPGRPYFMTGRDMHRVLMPQGIFAWRPRTSWSLFVHGPWTKDWGFYGYRSLFDDEGRPCGGIEWVYCSASEGVDDRTAVDHCWWRRAALGRMQRRAPA